MENEILEYKYIIPRKSSGAYTFNELTNKIIDDDDFYKFIYSFINKSDYSELEEYLDKFYYYICDIIDQSDSFYIDTKEDIVNYYREKIPYKTYYEKFYDANDKYIKCNIDVFDIRKVENKSILKNTISFNISDQERELFIVPINRKYILNKKNINGMGIIKFFKDHNLLLVLGQDDGYIYDYRLKEEIEKHKEKYRKMK